MESKNNLYDEFGNYIGDDIDSDEEEYSDKIDESKDGDSENRSEKSNSDVESKDENEEEDEDEDNYNTNGNKDNKMDENDIDELKKIYDGAEVFIEEEDTQDIEQATINKINANVERISFIKKLDVEANRKNFDLVETSLPNNNFSFKYLSELMSHTNFIRNICIAGHFHHGKTTLVDRLIEYTREKTKGDYYFVNKSGGGNNNSGSSSVSFFKLSDEFDQVIKKNIKKNEKKITPYNSKRMDCLTSYTDTRLDEQARGLSIKSIPISLIFQNKVYENIPNNILLDKKSQNLKYKSYLFNIIDTPGHVNFFDEFLCSLNVCECCCLVVDVVDGCMYVTDRKSVV